MCVCFKSFSPDFYKLHLDPNTAHRNLMLSEQNQQVTRGSAQPYSDHPERFDCWPQVLCREPLTGRCYWEVEWTGTAAIGLTYKSISRKGRGKDDVLGQNPKSLTLYCDENSYSVYHDKKKTEIDYPPYGCNRVGVFLDWPTGSVSFYRVSSEKLMLLHTAYSCFTEPLYAGFTLYPSDTAISLCKIEVWIGPLIQQMFQKHVNHFKWDMLAVILVQYFYHVKKRRNCD